MPLVEVFEFFVPWMKFATDFLIKGTPWEWEYAPTETISSSSSSARSMVSTGNRSFALFISSGYSVNAATWNVGLRKRRRIKNKEGKADLSDEGDRWLLKAPLLRVSDVGRHDLCERQRRSLLRIFQCLAKLFSFNRKLTADGVLDVMKGRVDIIKSEHVSRGRKQTEVVVDRSL